jgi:hypothetical protein
MVSLGGKMGREYEESKLFSDNLDRLMAGQEAKIGAITDSELLLTLNFAKKIAALRPEPSAQFKSNLKARLLQRLTVKEAAKESGQGWFGGLFRGQQVWITAAVCAALLIVVGTVLFRTGVIVPPEQFVKPPVNGITTATSASTTSATTNAPAGRYLLADASVDKQTYQPGETVTINVTLSNISGLPFTITQFPPILSLMDSDTKQAVYTFNAGQEQRTIPAGQKTNFTLTWNQQDTKGRPVEGGKYFIELEDLDLQGQAVKMNLSKPVIFDILPSASDSGNHKQEINQSFNLNGMAVNLQSLESSGTGFWVFVQVLPSNYQPNSENYGISAGYSIDGGWVKSISNLQMEYLPSGIRYTWFADEPLTESTSELTFIIYEIGGVRGPWQFDVMLK